ncbi:ABC transporter ATP-binding protein/permease [Mycoplasmatota bacterium]|nr:ABC transporter ATP-binding protein/permease [Mycoplasmatota bacterium]
MSKMIEIQHINKTFNKGKTNQINAIKETSLTFPNKGFVVIVGPSGSGKTTLLNVLGGLEYIDSGKIKIDDIEITSKNNRKLDQVRNSKIGYVFQNYNLLSNLSVYENIELVLKMLGITDKEEIDNRIHYVLKAVGMFNFRKRKVASLSGGQQQRVGIARAISKNPEIIIADEPTGNLDSKNTVEIMNIIKKISKEKLVIMVTHERDIANFYADRIIEIRDGVVQKDYLNKNQNALDIKNQNTIYLKDLQEETLSKTPIKIKHYKNQEGQSTENIEVTLISQNDSLYIKVNSNNNQKVRFIDEESDVLVLDEHYKGLDQTDVDKNEFDFNELNLKEQKDLKRGSVIKTKDAIIYAFKKMHGYTKLQKLMYLGFVFSAMMIAVAIALIGKVVYANPVEFLTVDRNYLQINVKDVDNIRSQDHIEIINPIVEPFYFVTHIHQFYQVNTYLPFSAHPTPLNLLKENDVIIGHYPRNKLEVVIDKRVADVIINNDAYKQAGINSYKQLLGLSLDNENIVDKLIIVGISDKSSPTIYLDEDTVFEMAINYEALSLPKLSVLETEQVEIIGSLPKNPGEILYPEKLKSINDLEIGMTIVRGEVSRSYTIVGFYKDKSNDSSNDEIVLTTKDLLESNYYQLVNDETPILIYSNNLKQTKAYLNEMNYQYKDIYNENLKEHQQGVRTAFYSLLVFSIILLSVSLLQLYFIVRSSLMNRIYDIGVYRSLGATRWDIHKLFVTEIIIVTTTTSLIGYILMTLIIKEIEKVIPYPFTLFYFPLYLIIGGVILLYAINIFSGLYPVFRLTHKSPSQILKHYDA